MVAGMAFSMPASVGRERAASSAMEEWGFTRVKCEYCIYYRKAPSGTIITAVHVDDFLSTASSKEESERFKAQLKTRWEISESDASFIVGIKLRRDLDARTIALSQTALISQIADEFNVLDARPVDLPMDPGLRLRRPDPPCKADEVKLSKIPYGRLVGHMGYVALGSRPDIQQMIQELSSFVTSYRYTHWEAAKRCA